VKFKQVDVFTQRPFLGNPVAVVIGAEELDTHSMQRIACWTNLSETTFLLQSAKADYRLRIFTPRQELPFAGHPTIGSAHAALESGFIPRKKRLVQECGAGLIQLSVEDDGRVFLKGPVAKVQALEKQIPSIPLVPGAKVVRIDVGPIWVVGEMSDAASLAALKPDMAALADYVGKRFGESYVARQGMQLGRDGRVSVRIRDDAIEIGGHAVTCVDGELRP
jgi:PhzF family phenazine biosynthesis protein